MKVIATKNGFYGYYRNEGDVFDVPEGEKATWFEPVEPLPEQGSKKDSKPKD